MASKRERQIAKIERQRVRQREQRNGQMVNNPAYFTAPRGYGQVNRDAAAADRVRYGGAQGQLELQGRQIPAWFADYRAALMTPGQVQAQYQPTIEQSQATAQQTGQTLGLEGPAGEQDQLAAKAREALANLGTATLQGARQADTTYFQGRQGVAAAAQLGAQGQNAQAQQTLAGERGAFRQQYVADARDAERAYGLQAQHQLVENKAFGLDVAKAQADVRTDRQKVRQDSREKTRERREKAQTVNQYGYSNEQWARFSPSHRRRIINEGKGEKAKAPAKTYTSAQHHTAKVDLRKAVALVQGRLGGKKTAPDTYWKQAYQALITEKNMDPALARAAIQLVRHGGVGSKTREALERDYGITKFPKGTKRKKPPAYRIPSRPGTAPSGTGGGTGNDSRRPS